MPDREDELLDTEDDQARRDDDIDTQFLDTIIATIHLQPDDAEGTVRTRQTTLDSTYRSITRASLHLTTAADARIDQALDGRQRFEIGPLLGEGGGGSVYTLIDHHLGREVAIKLLRQSSRNPEMRLNRFVEEARITARLEHPNILPVHDLATDSDGSVFFTMRKADGQSLLDLIDAAESGRIAPAIATLDDRLEIIRKVCDAVAFAHSRSIIHQDIKPSNIMIGSYGEVLLVDWGTAFDRSQQHPIDKLMGTPVYMAPEQARREGADERSDIYCIGATMYHLLGGCLPLRSTNPNEFWAMKRRGHYDALPADRRSRIPAFLARVIDRCMAADPAKRYADIDSLQQDLRSWQRNRESLLLTDRAEEALQAAAKAPEHNTYARVCERFRQALEAWPENERAQTGLDKTLGAQAGHAIDRGDLDLASSLIDELRIPRDDLSHRLDMALQRRARIQRRVWHQRLGIAALVCLLLAAGIVGVFEWQRRQGAWLVAYSHDFTADGLSQRIERTLRDVNAALSEPPVMTGDGMVAQPQLLHWVDDLEIRGDVRVTIDATWTKAVDGLEVLLRAKRENPPTYWNVPTAYVCQFGGYQGRINLIDIRREAGRLYPRHGVKYPLTVGRRYQLTFSLVGDRLSLAIDGQEIYHRRSLLPIGGADCNQIAFRGWQPVTIHRLRVERRRLPEVNSPLITGETLVANGLHSEAMQQFLALADDFDDNPAIAELAVAKALLVSTLIPGQQATSETIYERLLLSFPTSEWLTLGREAMCMGAWQQGSIDLALQRAEQLLEADPDSQIGIYLLDLGHRPMSATQEHRFLGLLGRSSFYGELDLNGWALRDISPLAGLELERLGLSDNRLTSLEPLRGMPLIHLDVSGNAISDLSPLTGMQLRSFFAGNNQIVDITPLAGMPLRNLQLPENRIASIDTLTGMPLRELSIGQNLIEDISPLADMPLEICHLNSNPIGNQLDRLIGLPIHTLEIKSCNVTDLRPLTRLPLRKLTISGNPATDASPLDGMTLIEFYAKQHRFTTLPYLPAARLIDCTVGSLTNIDTISRMPELRVVELEQNRLTHTPPFIASHLTKINLVGNQLTTVPVLDTPVLTTLLLSSNQITALDHLAGLELDELRIDDNPLTTLDGINETRVRQLAIIDCATLSDQAIADLAQAWRARQHPEISIKQVDTVLAFRQGQTARLRQLGERFGRHVYVFLPYAVDFATAQELARTAGGTLPRIRSPEQQAWFNAYLRRHEKNCWLDLHWQDDRWVWGDGSEPTFTNWRQNRIPIDPTKVWQGYADSLSAWIQKDPTSRDYLVVALPLDE